MSFDRLIFTFITALLFLSPPPLLAAADSDSAAHANHKPTPPTDEKAVLAFSQSVIGKALGDHTLINPQGQKIPLSSYRGRPLVISMIYTSCYHICPTVTQHLSTVMKKAKAALGKNTFNVITVGFDSPNDTPDAMRVFAAQQGVDSDNWQFLSADQETINALAQDLGFQFKASPKGFDHLIQATIVDGAGQIYRQVYDMNFSTPLMIEPLKELLDGQPRTGSLISHIGGKIRLFCTVYDPANDRYYVDYSIFIGLFIGLTSMGAILYIVIREWRRQAA